MKKLHSTSSGSKFSSIVPDGDVVDSYRRPSKRHQLSNKNHQVGDANNECDSPEVFRLDPDPHLNKIDSLNDTCETICETLFNITGTTTNSSSSGLKDKDTVS